MKQCSLKLNCDYLDTEVFTLLSGNSRRIVGMEDKSGGIIFTVQGNEEALVELLNRVYGVPSKSAPSHGSRISDIPSKRDGVTYC